MFRPALYSLTLLSCAAASAQYAPPNYSPQPYAPQSPTTSWQQVAEMPPGTLLVIHQRGSNWPIQCALAWINPKSLACDTPATTAPSQRLIFQANSVDSIQPLPAAPPPEPATAYVAPPAPVPVYTPPPRYSSNYGAYAGPEHHNTGVIVLCAAAGGLLGGLIGKGWSTQAGFLGAAFGGLGGAAIGFAATDAYDRPHYMIRVPLSHTPAP